LFDCARNPGSIAYPSIGTNWHPVGKKRSPESVSWWKPESITGTFKKYGRHPQKKSTVGGLSGGNEQKGSREEKNKHSVRIALTADGKAMTESGRTVIVSRQPRRKKRGEGEAIKIPTQRGGGEESTQA